MQSTKMGAIDERTCTRLIHTTIKSPKNGTARININHIESLEPLCRSVRQITQPRWYPYCTCKHCLLIRGLSQPRGEQF